MNYQWWLPGVKRHGHVGVSSVKGHEDDYVIWRIWHMKRCWELGLLSISKGRLRGDWWILSLCINTWLGAGLERWQSRTLIGVQWQYRQLWAQTEIWKISFKHQVFFLLWGYLNIGTGCLESCAVSDLRDIQNLTAHDPEQTAIADVALNRRVD